MLGGSGCGCRIVVILSLRPAGSVLGSTTTPVVATLLVVTLVLAPSAPLSRSVVMVLGVVAVPEVGAATPATTTTAATPGGTTTAPAGPTPTSGPGCSPGGGPSSVRSTVCSRSLRVRPGEGGI